MLFFSVNLSVIMPDYIFRFVPLFCSPIGLSVLQIGLSEKTVNISITWTFISLNCVGVKHFWYD